MKFFKLVLLYFFTVSTVTYGQSTKSVNLIAKLRQAPFDPSLFYVDQPLVGTNFPTSPVIIRAVDKRLQELDGQLAHIVGTAYLTTDSPTIFIKLKSIVKYEPQWRESLSCENSRFVVDVDARTKAKQIVVRHNPGAIKYIYSGTGGNLYNGGNTLVIGPMAKAPIRFDSESKQLELYWTQRNPQTDVVEQRTWRFYNCTRK